MYSQFILTSNPTLCEFTTVVKLHTKGFFSIPATLKVTSRYTANKVLVIPHEKVSYTTSSLHRKTVSQSTR